MVSFASDLSGALFGDNEICWPWFCEYEYVSASGSSISSLTPERDARNSSRDPTFGLSKGILLERSKTKWPISSDIASGTASSLLTNTLSAIPLKPSISALFSASKLAFDTSTNGQGTLPFITPLESTSAMKLSIFDFILSNRSIWRVFCSCHFCIRSGGGGASKGTALLPPLRRLFFFLDPGGGGGGGSAEWDSESCWIVRSDLIAGDCSITNLICDESTATSYCWGINVNAEFSPFPADMTDGSKAEYETFSLEMLLGIDWIFSINVTSRSSTSSSSSLWIV